MMEARWDLETHAREYIEKSLTNQRQHGLAPQLTPEQYEEAVREQIALLSRYAALSESDPATHFLPPSDDIVLHGRPMEWGSSEGDPRDDTCATAPDAAREL